MDHENDLSWLERVWMEVQAEIDYETAHPQDEWLGTSMHPVDAPL